jgi:plastocyanin
MRRTVRLSIALVPFVLVLGWAAAGVALAGGGCHTDPEPTATEGSATVVTIDGCTFAPTITRVHVGSEVRWVNASGAPHDVTGRKFVWGSDQLFNGDSYTHRFGTSGMYPYSCSLHPGMAGVVVVGAPVAANEAVDIAPVSATIPAAPTSAGDSTLPILAAGGLGILAGALIAGSVVSRRRPAN